MLVLCRKIKQKIILPELETEITLLESDYGIAKIAITSPNKTTHYILREDELKNVPEIKGKIMLTQADSTRARIGINAPKYCNIVREELLTNSRPWR